MHDIRFIRENPAAFDAGLKKRNLAPLSAEILAIDTRRRAAITESEQIQARRKTSEAMPYRPTASAEYSTTGPAATPSHRTRSKSGHRMFDSRRQKITSGTTNRP